MTNSRANNDPLSIVKPADESKTSDASLAADDTLILPVLASKIYSFQLILFVKAHATPDIKLDFTVPSGGSGTVVAGAQSGDTPATTRPIGTALWSATDDTVQSLLITGTVTISTTPGFFSFRWCQNASDANATIVKAGSSLKLWES